MKVIGFRIEYQGASEMLDISQRLGQELAQAADQLERFNRLSNELGATRKQYDDLLKKLRELNKEQKKSKDAGSGPSPGGSADTEKKVESLTEAIRRLNKEIAKGPVNGEEAYRSLVAQLGKLKAEQKGVRDEIRKQQKAFEEVDAAQGSYRQLSSTLSRLKNQYKELGEEARNSGVGRNLQKQIALTDGKLKELDASLGVYTRNVGNYRSAITGLGNAIQALGALTIAGVGLQQIAEANAQVSDSIADVRKTTGLTEDSLTGYTDIVKGLADQLETLDTRTSLDDLLQISAGGGQLGILSDITAEIEKLQQAREDALASGDQDLADALGLNIEEKLEQTQKKLFDFTKSVDTIGVALGDELPGDARQITVELTKLSETFGISAERGEELDVSILRTGSTINTLSAKTRASSEAILDFTKRLAGTAAQADIGLGDIAGIGATLDAAGISAEVSGTAIQQFLVDIPRDAERFAKVAGVPFEEFNRLLEEDATAAFRAVLGGAQSSKGGLAALSDVLEKAGITGSRAGTVINALTSNLEGLDDNLKIANDAFEDGQSVVEEFNVKNQTLGAEIDKLKNSLINLVVDTGFQDFLAKAVSGVTGFIGALIQLPKFVYDNRTAILALLAALVSFNAANIAAAAGNLRRLASEKLLPAAISLTTKAQKGLNAALKANPIGIVVGLVLALVSAFKFLYDNVEPVRRAVDQAVASFMEFYDSNLLVKAALGFIVEPLRLVALVVKDGVNSFYGFRAAAIAIFENVSNRAGAFVNDIQIFFKQLEDKLTFSDEGQKKLDKELSELKSRKKKFEEAGQDVGKAYRDAVAKAQEGAAQQAADKAAEKVEKETKGRPTAAGDDLDENAPDAGDRRSSADAKETEARIKEQQQALENLRKLQTQLIEDENDRQAQQELNTLADQLADIVGEPETVNAQAQALTQLTSQKINEVYANSRNQLQEQALKQIEEIGDQDGLLPSPEDIEARGQRITERLEEQTAAIFDRQREALRKAAEAAISQLQGTPEQVRQQTEQINQALDEQLSAIDDKEELRSETLTANEQERQAKILTLKLESIRQRYEQEQAEIDRLEAERLARLAEQVEGGNMSPEEIDEAQAEIEEQKREAMLEAERQFIEEKFAITGEGAADLIALEKERSEKQIALAKKTTEELKEEEEKRVEGQFKAADASINALTSAVKAGKELLAEDEENRKKYGKALKALALAEIGVNLFREIQAISAANSVYPDPLGTIIKAASVARAITTAALSVAKVKSQEFEQGDTLFVGYEDGGATPLSGANSTGGPPPKSGSGLQPQGRGMIPAHGMVQGPSHRIGGIPARTIAGDFVEIEGGEYAMRNGPYLHIINRRSTAKFRTRLDQMRRGNTQTYDVGRAQIASAMNSYKGWGRAFAQTGANLAVLNTPSIPVPAPATVSQGMDMGINQEAVADMARVARQLDEKTDAINNRVDTLQVITDPEAIVSGATSGRKQKRTR